ncbi:MAG: baseplate assembly protein [Magnetococcales bacterium]|nr:baseplate assembly protein [Magnetococcales bacterium]
MSEEISLYGQDIKLNPAMQALTAANGEALIVDGIATALQDIKLRLFTPLGSLFYDKAFGSDVYLFIKDENTALNRQALAAEVQYRVELDPRVEPQSCRASVAKWNHNGVTIRFSFRLINTTHPFNMILTADADNSMVIKDVDSR